MGHRQTHVNLASPKVSKAAIDEIWRQLVGIEAI